MLLLRNQKGTIDEQEANAYAAAKPNQAMENYNLVVTHGNGPQVGNIYLQILQDTNYRHA